MALKLESSKAQRTWQRKKLNGWTPDMHKYFWWLQKKTKKNPLAIWIMELETAMINRYPVTGHWCPSLPAIPHLCLVDWTEVLPRAKPSSVLSVAKEKTSVKPLNKIFGWWWDNSVKLPGASGGWSHFLTTCIYWGLSTAVNWEYSRMGGGILWESPESHWCVFCRRSRETYNHQCGWSLWGT